MEEAEKVVQFVHNFFESKLAKKGKPCLEKKEWTVLSAFVVKRANCSNLEVVALGTGTKCLGQNEVCALGDLVHDRYGNSEHLRILLIVFFKRVLYKVKVVPCHHSPLWYQQTPIQLLK